MATTSSCPYFLPQSHRIFSDQIEKVHSILNIKGKVLLLLRGLPGCGKTTLGNTIISMLGTGKIFSADDYFYYNGQYMYRPNEIPMAHAACQNSVKNAIQSMESLIIVANTNLEKWQMAPYANMAAKNGYYLVTMEPNTPWRKDVAQLARLNLHGISKKKLYDLRDRFEKVKASDLLLQEPLEIPPRAAPPPLTKMPEVTQESNSNASGPSSPRGGAPISQRDQKRRPKPQGKHLTRKDAAALFETVRLSGDLGKWAEPKEGRCTPPKTPGISPAGSRQHLGPPKAEASTSITDLDLVFLAEDPCDSDLALDLGFRVLLVRGTWEEEEKKEEEESPGSHKACQTGDRMMTGDLGGRRSSELLDRIGGEDRQNRMTHSKSLPPEQRANASTGISELDHVFFTEEPWESLALDLGYRLVLASGVWEEEEEKEEMPGHHMACQTQETPTTPVPEGLRSLCSIFPHAQDSDLADLLRVTGGDVEWAVDVFLQSGYADGLSCERPAVMEPPGDSNSSSSAPLSPSLSSPELSEETPEGAEREEDEEGAPRLSLDRVFLRSAHRRFGSEFAADALDVECLPAELLEKWELPESLARAIYASYLEHLGQIERADSQTAVEAVRTAAPLAGRAQIALSTQRGRAPPTPSNNVRDIMEEEEVMARIYADRRKDLITDTASMIKLKRLTKAFPNLERQELMDIFISFQHREDWTRAHLLTLGHVMVEAAEECGEAVAESGEAAASAELGAAAFAKNKQELMREKARLMARKAHLQEQLRKVAGQRDLMAAAGFYVGEVYAVDKSLASLCERLREVRLSEQAADLLDLHHFSVAEALASLKQRLAECRAERRRQLLVLTGVGRHSHGKAKLRPAVRQFLQQSHLKFEEIYNGAFRINV